MDITLEDAVGRLREFDTVFAPADKKAIQDAHQRGVPPELIDFYRQCNGGFFIDGRDFTGPDNRTYRLMIPRISEVQTVQAYGDISEDSVYYQASASWWQILDYGDSNGLVLDATQEGRGQIIDVFHETVGEADSHAIIEESLAHLFWQIVEFEDCYWLAENFEPLGYV